jgi:hypothetical protein
MLLLFCVEMNLGGSKFLGTNTVILIIVDTATALGFVFLLWPANGINKWKQRDKS